MTFSCIFLSKFTEFTLFCSIFGIDSEWFMWIAAGEYIWMSFLTTHIPFVFFATSMKLLKTSLNMNWRLDSSEKVQRTFCTTWVPWKSWANSTTWPWRAYVIRCSSAGLLIRSNMNWIVCVPFLLQQILIKSCWITLRIVNLWSLEQFWSNFWQK